MSEICQEVVKVTTTGADGSATGSGNSGAMNGFLLDIYLDFNASAPNTTDVTIAFAGRGGNVLAVSNANTDALYTPRAKPVDNANADITDAHDMFPLNGSLSVAVAGCNALTNAVIAYIRYLRV